MAGEEGILEALLDGRPAAPPGWVGVGDDACAVPAEALGGERLCLSVDALEQDVHFRSGWQGMDDLAWRLLAVALSDLAAVGAEPLGYLLEVSWPEALGEAEARRLGRALREAEAAFGCPLLGGDTDVRSGGLRLAATVLGRSPAPLRRAGGRAGDLLFVSGPLGGAAAVVTTWLADGAETPPRGGASESASSTAGSDAAWEDARRRFLRPRPRLELGRALRGQAHALINLSDGLLPDLRALASASGLAAEVDTSRLPLHPAAAARSDGLELALAGGEDYELLVAGPETLRREPPGLIEIGALLAATRELPAGRVLLRGASKGAAA